MLSTSYLFAFYSGMFYVTFFCHHSIQDNDILLTLIYTFSLDFDWNNEVNWHLSDFNSLFLQRNESFDFDPVLMGKLWKFFGRFFYEELSGFLPLDFEDFPSPRLLRVFHKKLSNDRKKFHERQ